jgi:hypothetical protein
MGRAATLLLAVVAAAVLTGCGVRASGDVRVVDAGRVPDGLLDPTIAAAPVDLDATADSALRLYWVDDDDRLVATPPRRFCVSSLAGVVDELLDQLIEGPEPGQRSDGLGSAVPSSDWVHVVRIDDGDAVLSVDPDALAGDDRVIVAAAQVVLSVTSVPGVDAVELVHTGEPVQVPLPDGRLTPGPFIPEEYDDLLAQPAPAAASTPLDPRQLTCPSPRR